MDALQFLYAIFQATVLALFVFAMPVTVFGVIIHLLNHIIRVRLISRFGWNSILATAWLGTPIHELSHAAMCLFFGHSIKEIALFRPDRQAMRLGYVIHAYNPRNPFQVVGQFFIGLAPLAVGSAVIYLLAFLFYYDVVALPDSSVAAGLAVESTSVFDFPQRVLASVQGIVNPANLITLRFWGFLYLVLCVGGHMSPSASDFEQIHWGALAMLLVLVVANAIAIGLGGEPTWLIQPASTVMIPLFAALSVCLLLFAVVAGLVVAATWLWDIAMQR